MPRTSSGPRYYPTRGAYYAVVNGVKTRLAGGRREDPKVITLAWRKYWEVAGTPLAERLRAVDWSEVLNATPSLAEIYYAMWDDVRPEPDAIPDWLVRRGNGTEEYIPIFFDYVGVTESYLYRFLKTPVGDKRKQAKPKVYDGWAKELAECAAALGIPPAAVDRLVLAIQSKYAGTVKGGGYRSDGAAEGAEEFVSVLRAAIR